MNAETCPAPDALAAALEREPDAALAAHVADCPACRAALDALAAGESPWLLDSAGGPAPLPDALRAALLAVPDAVAARAETPGGGDTCPDEPEPFPEPPLPERVGPYRVLGLLGRGGMGVVLRAWDDRLDRPVALKVPGEAVRHDPETRERFRREARAAARLDHPAIVPVYAAEDVQGVPVLVMALVDGESLQQRLSRDGPLPAVEALAIARRLAEALAAAHARGLVHRDVKPANVLLDADGVARLTDFGLARAADDAKLTRTGLGAGTPMFMSPEQARGEPIDARSDLFSLGGVLYAMLAGRPPFPSGTLMGTLRRVADGSPDPLRQARPDLPRHIEEVVMLLLERSPARRPRTAADAAERLDAALTRLARDPAPPRPRRTLRYGAAVLLAGAMLAAGVVVRVPVPEGTLVVEIDDPAATVSVDRAGETLTLTGVGVQEIKLPLGAHRVKVAPGAGPEREELVAVERGGRVVVRATLERGGKGKEVAAKEAAKDEPRGASLQEMVKASLKAEWQMRLEEAEKRWREAEQLAPTPADRARANELPPELVEAGRQELDARGRNATGKIRDSLAYYERLVIDPNSDRSKLPLIVDRLAQGYRDIGPWANAEKYYREAAKLKMGTPGELAALEGLCRLVASSQPLKARDLLTALNKRKAEIPLSPAERTEWDGRSAELAAILKLPESLPAPKPANVASEWQRPSAIVPGSKREPAFDEDAVSQKPMRATQIAVTPDGSRVVALTATIADFRFGDVGDAMMGAVKVVSRMTPFPNRNAVVVWDATTRRPVLTPADDQNPSELHPMADGRSVAVTSQTGVSIRRLSDYAAIRDIPRERLSGGPVPYGRLAPVGWQAGVLRLSPGGQRGFTDSHYARPTIEYLEPGGKSVHFTSHGEVSTAEFSPDETLLFAGTDKGHVGCWDAATGAPRFEAKPGDGEPIRALALLPGGKSVAALEWVPQGRSAANLYLLDAATGAVRRTAPAHLDGGETLAASADGRFLFTAGRDRAVRAWDAETLRLVGEIPTAYSRAVFCAVPHPSSDRLYVGGEGTPHADARLIVGPQEFLEFRLPLPAPPPPDARMGQTLRQRHASAVAAFEAARGLAVGGRPENAYRPPLENALSAFRDVESALSLRRDLRFTQHREGRRGQSDEPGDEVLLNTRLMVGECLRRLGRLDEADDQFGGIAATWRRLPEGLVAESQRWEMAREWTPAQWPERTAPEAVRLAESLNEIRVGSFRLAPEELTQAFWQRWLARPEAERRAPALRPIPWPDPEPAPEVAAAPAKHEPPAFRWPTPSAAPGSVVPLEPSAAPVETPAGPRALAVGVAPNGSAVIGLSDAGRVALWEPKSARVLGEFTPAGKWKSMHVVRDDALALFGESGAAVFELPAGKRRHGREVPGLRVGRVAPDGKRFAVADAEGVALIEWEGASPPARLGPLARVAALAFATDGSAVYAATETGVVACWDTQTRAKRFEVKIGDTPLVALALEAGPLYALEGMPRDRFAGDLITLDPQTGVAGERAAAHRDGGTTLFGVPKGAGVYSAGRDGYVRVWSANSMRLAGAARAFAGPVAALERPLHPDGVFVIGMGKPHANARLFQGAMTVAQLPVPPSLRPDAAWIGTIRDRYLTASGDFAKARESVTGVFQAEEVFRAADAAGTPDLISKRNYWEMTQRGLHERLARALAGFREVKAAAALRPGAPPAAARAYASARLMVAECLRRIGHEDEAKRQFERVGGEPATPPEPAPWPGGG